MRTRVMAREGGLLDEASLAQWMLCFAVMGLALLWADPAFAGSLPWDRGLSAIGDTLTGKVAAGVGVIGIGIVGIGAAVNADMGGAAKGVVGVAVILGIIVAGKALVDRFGLTGAVLL